MGTESHGSQVILSDPCSKVFGVFQIDFRFQEIAELPSLASLRSPEEMLQYLVISTEEGRHRFPCSHCYAVHEIREGTAGGLKGEGIFIF